MPSFVAGVAHAAAAPAGHAAVNGGELSAVSCPTSSWCMAVGNGTHSGEGLPGRPLTYRLSDGRWRQVAAPHRTPAGHQVSGLSTVSCPSVSDCYALGTASTSSSPTEIIAEHFDGRTWSFVPVQRPGHVVTTSVSCAGSGRCDAVGTRYTGDPFHGGLSRAVAWVLRNGRLRLVPTARRMFPNETLKSVSCVTATACTAVGGERAGNLERPLIETWNGARWSAVRPLARPPAGDGPSVLSGVSCPAPGSCVASGTTVGQVRTLVYNRRRRGPWRFASPQVALPGQDRTEVLQFGSVSCLAYERCAGAGSFTTYSRSERATVEWRGGGRFRATRAPSGTEQLDAVDCKSVCTWVGESTPVQQPLVLRGTGGHPTREKLPTPVP